MQPILEFLYYFVVIALVFGISVFVHEFGHMFFALIRGVGVESFAIGMGPKIFAWHWFGIEFSLRWFPVGGFVKLAGLMPGEELEEASDGPQTRAFAPEELTNSIELGNDNGLPAEAESKDKSLTESSYDDLNALANKGLLTKLLVFGGGVFMNYVTAIVAMAIFIMLPHSEPLTELTIWKVDPTLPAAKAGLQNGDHVVAVNGHPVSYMHELFDMMESQFKKDGIDPDSDAATSYPLTLTVQREAGGTTETVKTAPIEFAHFVGDPNLKFALPPIVGEVVLNQPAEKAGLQGGDRILSVNGKPIRYFGEMADLIETNVDKPIALEYRRGNEVKTATLTPLPSYEDQSIGKIGISNGGAEYRMAPGRGFIEAVVRAPGATWDRLVGLVMAHVDFFRKATLKQVGQGLGGPVMIARMISQAAKHGASEVVNFFVTLNLLLMVFNLLPFPVLDGGFILISIIEAAMRRPVPARVLAPIYTAFVIFFISLMALITLLDIKRKFF